LAVDNKMQAAGSSDMLVPHLP